MVKTVKDVQIFRLREDGSVARDYGVHDGNSRDGEDVALKYYAADLEPGQSFKCRYITRTIITWGDLSEKQRTEVQRSRQIAEIEKLDAKQ
jgi:hypothetical protein